MRKKCIFYFSKLSFLPFFLIHAVCFQATGNSCLPRNVIFGLRESYINDFGILRIHIGHFVWKYDPRYWIPPYIFCARIGLLQPSFVLGCFFLHLEYLFIKKLRKNYTQLFASVDEEIIFWIEMFWCLSTQWIIISFFQTHFEQTQIWAVRVT